MEQIYLINKDGHGTVLIAEPTVEELIEHVARYLMGKIVKEFLIVKEGRQSFTLDSTSFSDIVMELDTWMST